MCAKCRNHTKCFSGIVTNPSLEGRIEEVKHDGKHENPRVVVAASEKSLATNSTNSTKLFRVIREIRGKPFWSQFFNRARPRLTHWLSKLILGCRIYEPMYLAPIHQVEELVAIQDLNPGLLRRFPPLQPQPKSASNLQRQRAA